VLLWRGGHLPDAAGGGYRTHQKNQLEQSSQALGAVRSAQQYQELSTGTPTLPRLKWPLSLAAASTTRAITRSRFELLDVRAEVSEAPDAGRGPIGNDQLYLGHGANRRCLEGIRFVCSSHTNHYDPSGAVRRGPVPGAPRQDQGSQSVYEDSGGASQEFVAPDVERSLQLLDREIAGPPDS